MATDKTYPPDLIAPCGINCRVCLGFLREKNKCPGCKRITVDTSKYRLNCRIRNCELLAGTSSKLCYECPKLPCQRLKQLDKRYRIRYSTDLIANLLEIKEHGMPAYLENEKKKWTCKRCGETISVHRGYCTICEQSQ